MAEPDMDEEDLFADLYEGDDAPSKDPISAPSQPSAPEPSAPTTGPGYGEEPEFDHDPTSFEVDMATQEPSAFGTNGDHPDQEEASNDSPGIRMKDDGKMFIGGLNWETTDQSLHDYFSQFGEVAECTVMRDGATGRSRGFGFLTFKDPRTVNTVMVKEHFLDGKIIDPKRAIPKDEQEKTAKIFVGGVSQEATEADFTGFFAQFGRVIDATLMMDKDTGRPRGFGFVTFDSDTAVERVLDYHPLEILAKPIEVKRAQPRGKMGEEEDFSRGRGGRGKFGGREDRFSDSQSNQNQSPAQGQAGMNGMSPQMMAQYWQRMQQYFQMMQQQMMANAMGNMGNMNMGGQMNPQMMRQMQQMQQMQQNMGGASPNSQNMNPQMQQQMMQMMQMQQQQGQQGGMGNGGGQQRPPSGPQGNNRQGSQGSFSANEQIAFEQQKYEQQARRTNVPHGPRGYQQGPQSWEGMYDDVPQPEGAQGGRGGPARNNTPTGKPPKGPAQPSNAPANAPTGPKIATKPGGGFRGGRGHGRFHPYGRG